jgi:hypothetical protein
VRKVPGIQLVTQQEIAALLGFEKQRALLGCQSESCVAEVGGALGVERLIIGSLSKLGESWLITLRLMDAKKARTIAQADRRLRNGTLDDVLDALPRMVKEIFATEPAPAAEPVKPAPVAEPANPAPATEPAKPTPAAEPASAGVEQAPGKAWVEEPVAETLTATLRKDLKLARDRKGLYVGWLPDSVDTLFAGDGKTFFRQAFVLRVGSKAIFEYTFWEPRSPGFPRGAVRQRKDGKPELECGNTRTALESVPDAEAKALLEKATFDKPRWRRSLRLMAKDEAGNYFVVDQAHRDKDADIGHRDLRLFKGAKGHLAALAVTAFTRENPGATYTTPQGRLVVTRQGKIHEAEWVAGDKHTKLVWLPLEENFRLAYSELGIYAGEKLGTACDGAFP